MFTTRYRMKHVYISMTQYSSKYN